MKTSETYKILMNHNGGAPVRAPLCARCLVATMLAFGVVSGARAQFATATVTPSPSAITPNEQQIETGPVLDVVPYVLSDGYTINLTLIPSLLEFTGYSSPPPVPNTAAGVANVVLVPTILPNFSVREITTTVNVWDGQTVALGGLIYSTISQQTDKVPVLGDVPLLGRLFQSQTKTTTKRNLMIFVTATLIDPAGNRTHTDDELPFAQTGVPPQPPPAPGQIQTGEIKPRTAP